MKTTFGIGRRLALVTNELPTMLLKAYRITPCILSVYGPPSLDTGKDTTVVTAII
jgi:hypothetical protein